MIAIKKCAFRLDDITPGMNWDNFEKLKQLFTQYHIKPLLGVVPDNRDAHLSIGACREDFWAYMRALQQEGWSIAQHGCYHIYETACAGLLGINPFSEFAGLPYEQQYEKLKKGKAILREHHIETDIFMAPGHTYDAATVKALVQNGFQTVTDGYSERPYRYMGLTFLPSRMSGAGTIKGTDTVCLHPNSMDEAELMALARFMEQNKAYLCSYSELLAINNIPDRTFMITLEEKKNLFLRRIKNSAAGSGAMQLYLQKSNASSRGKKLCKRILMLPLIPYYCIRRAR